MMELRRTLSRKFRLAHDELSSAVEPIQEAISQIIEHDLKITGICRDKNDDNILACAPAAKAAYLVTGDADLLEVKKYQGVKIVTPRDFEALFV
jgi:putative PIN family toxin of toxin-antitoxin system